MLTTLETTYTDTCADDLAWALGRQPLPALAVLDLRLGGTAVQLRLLGASHQVLVEDERGACSETVACMPGSRTPLPPVVARRVGDWDYAFSAQVETLSQESFAARAEELIALVTDHPYGLAGTFPGSPYAFTALLAQGGGGMLRWRTWHAYPQEGRLVATRTRIGARVGAQLDSQPGAQPGAQVGAQLGARGGAAANAPVTAPAAAPPSARTAARPAARGGAPAGTRSARVPRQTVSVPR